MLDLYILNNFQLIFPSLQFLLDIFIALNDDGEEDIDENPADRDSKEEEHYGGNCVRLLEYPSDFDQNFEYQIVNFNPIYDKIETNSVFLFNHNCL